MWDGWFVLGYEIYNEGWVAASGNVQGRAKEAGNLYHDIVDSHSLPLLSVSNVRYNFRVFINVSHQYPAAVLELNMFNVVGFKLAWILNLIYVWSIPSPQNKTQYFGLWKFDGNHLLFSWLVGDCWRNTERLLWAGCTDGSDNDKTWSHFYILRRQRRLEQNLCVHAVAILGWGCDSLRLTQRSAGNGRSDLALVFFFEYLPFTIYHVA